MAAFPKQGDWVRWTTFDWVKEGEVVRASPPSLVIRWATKEEPQVFPVAEPYLNGEMKSSTMIVIPAPKRKLQAVPDAPAVSAAIVTPKEAAAVLGIDMRVLRQRLRSGKVKGLQRDGRWVEVYL